MNCIFFLISPSVCTDFCSVVQKKARRQINLQWLLAGKCFIQDFTAIRDEAIGSLFITGTNPALSRKVNNEWETIFLIRNSPSLLKISGVFCSFIVSLYVNFYCNSNTGLSSVDLIYTENGNVYISDPP